MKTPDSMLGPHPFEDLFYSQTVPMFVIPIASAIQAFAERQSLASTMGQSAIARQCNAGMRSACQAAEKAVYFVIPSEARNLSSI